MKSWPRTFASCCSLIGTLAAAAACGAVNSDAPAVAADVTMFATSAWARPADSGAATAVYFVLENRDTLADTVRGATSDAAELAGLHISTQQAGMMHMTEVPALPVPARDSVAFRPLGAHVMLMRLYRPLVAGDTVAVTLSFGSGRTLDVRAGVRAP